MTSGDQYPEMASDEAQVVIGRVAEVLERGEPAERAEGFETLPEQVRQTLRNLSVSEGQLLANTLRVFRDNGFYITLPHGGIVGYV
jgi:hypothetical protein